MQAVNPKKKMGFSLNFKKYFRIRVVRNTIKDLTDIIEEVDIRGSLKYVPTPSKELIVNSNFALALWYEGYNYR